MKSTFGCRTEDQGISGLGWSCELALNEACSGRKVLSGKLERSSSPTPLAVEGRMLDDPEKRRLRVEDADGMGPAEKPLLRASGDGGIISERVGGKDGLRVVDEAAGRRG